MPKTGKKTLKYTIQGKPYMCQLSLNTFKNQRELKASSFPDFSSEESHIVLYIRVVHNFSSGWQKFLSSQIVIIEP